MEGYEGNDELRKKLLQSIEDKIKNVKENKSDEEVLQY
jgi:hypothetical protein